MNKRSKEIKDKQHRRNKRNKEPNLQIKQVEPRKITATMIRKSTVKVDS